MVAWRFRACRRIGIEGGELKDTAQQVPGIRQIGDQDGGARLTDVPIRPLYTKGLREGIVLVEDGGEDGEDGEAEDEAENGLAAEREGSAYDHLHGHDEHDEVGGDVENGVGDEMVRGCAALGVWCWNGPVVVKWATPLERSVSLCTIGLAKTKKKKKR